MLGSLGAEYELHKSQVHAINAHALFPSESLLWDNDLIPIGAYDGEAVLAMPKLNLQFLTVYDYLLRSFKLFRLESAYQIRQDLVRLTIVNVVDLFFHFSVSVNPKKRRKKSVESETVVANSCFLRLFSSLAMQGNQRSNRPVLVSPVHIFVVHHLSELYFYSGSHTTGTVLFV